MPPPTNWCRTLTPLTTHCTDSKRALLSRRLTATDSATDNDGDLPPYMFCGPQLPCAYLRPGNIAAAPHAAAIRKRPEQRLQAHRRDGVRKAAPTCALCLPTSAAAPSSYDELCLPAWRSGKLHQGSADWLRQILCAVRQPTTPLLAARRHVLTERLRALALAGTVSRPARKSTPCAWSCARWRR